MLYNPKEYKGKKVCPFFLIENSRPLSPWGPLDFLSTCLGNDSLKTRDVFKKIRYTKGTFHAKMGSVKDRNGMDLTEAEDIKKKWQETQKNYTKKIFMTQIIAMV